MAEGPNKTFDAGAYWRDRVVSGSDLAIVGHRSMGLAYNAQIYERRLEALGRMLDEHAPRPVDQLRILDIGCGSGFYTGYWSERGVRDYVGVDISSATIEHLAGQYPDYEFINADITAIDTSALSGRAPFDVITVFDVFYHIVDDARFAAAVRHIGELAAEGGLVLIMDQLSAQRYQLSKHVVYRDREEYLDLFQSARLDLVDAELLFHYLVPPLSGSRIVDYATAGMFKLLGFVLRISDRLAGWVARRVRRADERLRASGKQVSNSELLAFGKQAE